MRRTCGCVRTCGLSLSLLCHRVTVYPCVCVCCLGCFRCQVANARTHTHKAGSFDADACRHTHSDVAYVALIGHLLCCPNCAYPAETPSQPLSSGQCGQVSGLKLTRRQGCCSPMCIAVFALFGHVRLNIVIGRVSSAQSCCALETLVGNI